MGKFYQFDQDVIDLIEKNKKNHGSEKNLIQTAIREYFSRIAKEKYDKMLNELNLKKYDTD